ncbi:hypothetical protein L7F22_003010 [Adiantum nelumboides]|nr:hypothetical protein [Adiantum nelumboides]
MSKPNAPFKPPTSSKFTLPAKRPHCPNSRGTLGSRYATYKKLRKEDEDDDDDDEQCVPMSTDQLSKHTLETKPSSSQTSSAGEVEGQFYACLYRAPQTRVHKTWETDGYIFLKPGSGCRLYDLDSKRFVSEDTVKKPTSLVPEQTFFIGSKEVLVGERTTKNQLFGLGKKSQSSSAAAQDQAKKNSQKDSAKALFKPPKKALEGRSNNLQAGHATTGTTSDEPIMTNLFYGDNTSPLKLGITKRQHDLKPTPFYSPEKYDDLVAMDRPDERHQERFNLKGGEVVDVHINPLLSRKMRPDQIEGVRFLYNSVTQIRSLVESSNIGEDNIRGRDDDEMPESAGAILADEMGLGKTLQTIAVIDMLLRQCCYFFPKRRHTIEKVLVVCPATLVNNWKTEFIKWLGREFRVLCVDEKTNIKSVINGKYEVLILNYEKVRNHNTLLSTARFGLLVCDEAHQIRNAGSQITQALEALRIERKILLTGTPIQNNLMEFYTMINFIARDYLGDPTTFKKEFENPITRGRKPNCLPKHRDMAEQRSRLLQKITAPLLLRRTADIVTHLLPPKHEIVLFCNPSPLQHKIYTALASFNVKQSTTDLKRTAFERIILLKKLCSAPDLVIDDVHGKGKAGKRTREIMGAAYNSVPTVKTECSQDSGKICALLKLLEAIREKTDDKVIVVSHFTITLDVIEKVCKRKNYPCLRLDGNTKQNSRSGLVQEFNTSAREKCFIMLLSAKAGGAGLNLIGANRLFMLDGDWNPAIDHQAMGRIHRSGQKKECYIYRLMLSGTLDEKIFQRQISKMGLSDALMVKSEASTSSYQLTQKDSNLADDFSEEELMDIFRYQPDTPCSTHDMLQCPCGGKGTPLHDVNNLFRDQTPTEDDDDDDGDDEEHESLPYDKMGFIMASQVTEAMLNRRIKENRKKLASLFDWNHHDFSKVDNSVLTQDKILNTIIEEDAKSGDTTNDKNQNKTFSSTSKSSGAILYVFAKQKRKQEKEDVLTDDESLQEDEGIDEEGSADE